ncbi:MAG: TonB-dependent receptor plug [Bacteroidetes bacterium]|nr:MAG: TonB-dependent receptor plug [Bacteroidota bacterium]
MKNCVPKEPVIRWFKSMLILLFTLSVSAVFGQDRNIAGTVTDQSTNESLPGATVLVKGTAKGTSTDMDGNFTLTVGSNEKVLVISFVGYESTEVTIGTSNVLKIQLVPAKTSLQEVVVVGYGSVKVKDLTSAITTIKSDELVKTPSATPLQALQGKVAGLQVVTGGGPGDSPTIRVRGVGSFPGRDNEAPLFVVDGMFFDNIDFLNPSDIASMSVLKDASASAIYGVRAANGVVLIETKSGSYNQKTEISYSGYTGYQVAQNIVKMANAQQFSMMALESGSVADQTFVLNAMQRYGRSRINPNVPDVNTDWYSEVLRPAPQTNHSLDISGGNDKARYSIGSNYFFQDGILKMDNQYERMNLRTKLDIKATKWLTVGGNLIFSNATKFNAQNSAWNQAYFAVPIMPVYDENNTAATPINYSNAQDLGYRSGQNPFPTMDFNIDRMKIKKVLANYYAELNLIPQTLTFKTSYNYNYSSIDQRVVNLPWFIGNSFQNPDATITRTYSIYNNKIWDNVLTYNKSINNHTFVVMAGSSFKDEGFQKLSAQGKNFPTDQEQSWYLNQSLNIPAEAVWDDGLRQYGMSYFGRVSYNFSDKYLLYGTLRADGSNKYQQKWGYFPTVGAGWVISEEGFLKGNDYIQFLKLRASWGQLGNDRIQASDGAFTTNVVTTTLGGIVYYGTVVNNTFSTLKWELTEETNIGFSSKLLKDKLSVEFDYFIRDTKNAAIPVIIPGQGGSVLKPVGVIRNSGIELALNWSNTVNNKLSYSVGANISTLKNEAMDLYGQTYIDGGSAEFRQRTYLGEPLMAFYGREVAGVYQNQAEIDADPVAVANGLVPGDFKYKDQNSDGKIDDDDRVILGSYFPNFMYGGNISITYGSLDFSTSVYGQMGNKILNRKRGELIWTPDGNLDADLAINRWHGEGTSNEYPSSAGLRKGWNQKMSDYFVEDGSFFRIQNVQLGYTLRNSKWLNGQFPEARIYFTAERPLTLFQYNGFTPEVANGWDSQTYPVAAVYTIGLNVKF